jgi:hypothetical protein
MSIDTDWNSAGAVQAKPAVKSILMRLCNAIIEAQRRHDEREVVRHLASKGLLSDPIEREIMCRLSGRPWAR